MAELRLLVTGEREWSDREQVERELDIETRGFSVVTIVHGACPAGVDAYADAWATAKGFTVERHPADWQTQGSAAGPIRNRKMARLGATRSLAFWSGKRNNSGTLDALVSIVRHGIPTRVVPKAKP